MTREELLALKIKPINKKIEKEVKAIWDGIAKPLDGLGEFELLLARIGGILGSTDLNLQKKAIIAMCADNGIVAFSTTTLFPSGWESTAGKRFRVYVIARLCRGREIFLWSRR